MIILKRFSILALVTSLILMVGGICIATYYIDNLAIRGLFIFILILLNILVSNIQRQVFKMDKVSNY